MTAHIYSFKSLASVHADLYVFARWTSNSPMLKLGRRMRATVFGAVSFLESQLGKMKSRTCAADAGCYISFAGCWLDYFA
jgi:hypothetical protein